MVIIGNPQSPIPSSISSITESCWQASLYNRSVKSWHMFCPLLCNKTKTSVFTPCANLISNFFCIISWSWCECWFKRISFVTFDWNVLKFDRLYKFRNFLVLTVQPKIKKGIFCSYYLARTPFVGAVIPHAPHKKPKSLLRRKTRTKTLSRKYSEKQALWQRNWPRPKIEDLEPDCHQ